MTIDSARPKRRRRIRPAEFYARALTEAELEAVDTAREVEGLDDEIATLRVKLLSALTQNPDDFDLLLKGVQMLVRAVSARYRISAKSEDDLYQSVVGVLKGVGEVLGLPEDGDGR